MATSDSAALAELVVRLQAEGLRTSSSIEGRTGGAGPSDVGMLWVDDVAVTLDSDPTRAARSPFELRTENGGHAIYEDGQRVAGARPQHRPTYYELLTADGVPYWQIALMHLDSLASTVLQTCAYWGNADQCTFCGIGVSLAAGRTIAKKHPDQLAEVAVAARDLDGAVDVTLTTGSTRAPDRGALYIAECARAVKEASGLPVEVQFEPPEDLDVLDRVRALGADTVGIHVETFDPEVLARVAPAKARTGIDHYFAAWERAVSLFGRGQVTTYVILGMGEDPDLTVDGCRRAIELGVYPFIVPLRPVAGSLMGSWSPPEGSYVEQVVRRVMPHLQAHGLGAASGLAGCSRCHACSPMAAIEQQHRSELLQIGRKPVETIR
jgi:radical SAM protein (TIGR04043 family)